MVIIAEAAAGDLPAIFALHQQAFQGEAQACYGNHRIRPLRMTLAEFVREAERATVLKAVDGGRIVGSATIRLENGTCYIGSVVVRPESQNQGIGTRLMQAAEAYFQGVERFELFTGEKSARNLYLYRKLGYRPFKIVREDELVNLIFLEKRSDLASRIWYRNPSGRSTDKPVLPKASSLRMAQHFLLFVHTKSSIAGTTARSLSHIMPIPNQSVATMWDLHNRTSIPTHLPELKSRFRIALLPQCRRKTNSDQVKIRPFGVHLVAPEKSL